MTPKLSFRLRQLSRGARRPSSPTRPWANSEGDSGLYVSPFLTSLSLIEPFLVGYTCSPLGFLSPGSPSPQTTQQAGKCPGACDSVGCSGDTWGVWCFSSSCHWHLLVGTPPLPSSPDVTGAAHSFPRLPRSRREAGCFSGAPPALHFNLLRGSRSVTTHLLFSFPAFTFGSSPEQNT